MRLDPKSLVAEIYGIERGASIQLWNRLKKSSLVLEVLTSSNRVAFIENSYEVDALIDLAIERMNNRKVRQSEERARAKRNFEVHCEALRVSFKSRLFDGRGGHQV